MNGAQAIKVRALYEPLYGIDGTLLYPRLQPGTETTTYGAFFSGAVSALASDWYKHVVYDPNFNPEALTKDDFAVAAAQDPFNISTSIADLSDFQRMGGQTPHFPRHGRLHRLVGYEHTILSSPS